MPARTTNTHLERRPWWQLDEGVPVALTVLAAWGYMINYTCFHTQLGTLQSALLFLPMMQLHTGVFITAHEAMHGSVAPNNPWLNDAIGRLAGTLYAGLDFTYMRQKHREHHAHTGLVGEDPDFHPGTGRDLGPWAWNFMKRYLSIWQFVRLNIMVGAIQLSGAPYLNMVVFLLCAGLLSAVQLFYFGTYIPHRPPKDSPNEVMHWEKAQTSACKTRLGSFLTCYSFDCHYEHHANPRTPWFRLWDDRKARLAGMADKLIK
jgi:beta-carotene ketolase (CrtW type)